MVVGEIKQIHYPYEDKFGKSHLASVRICGNKGYPVRKPAYTDDIYDPAKVHNEVQYLSYYLKNRRAAAENENRAPKLESARLKNKTHDEPLITYPTSPVVTPTTNGFEKASESG